MVVLVTGAAGFIGSHILSNSSQQGLQVRATAREHRTSRISWFCFPKKLKPHLKLFQMDLLQLETVEKAVQGCSEVIHCAAALMIDVQDAKKDVVDPSVIGTENLCAAIEKNPSIKTVIHIIGCCNTDNNVSEWSDLFK